MTTKESFKRRVRQRMARTGERYTTARLALLALLALLARSAEVPAGRARTWVSEPEMGDDAVRSGTGEGWEHWCDLIDSWRVDPWDHAAVGARLRRQHQVDGWWAQAIVDGYERITGLRLPHQMADGTFTANKSRTVAVDAGQLRSQLLDDDARLQLFGDEPSELRSRPTTKVPRFRIGPGVALIGLEPRPGGRTRVTVQHERLPAYDDVERWKFWWSEWLEAIDGDG